MNEREASRVAVLLTGIPGEYRGNGKQRGIAEGAARGEGR